MRSNNINSSSLQTDNNVSNESHRLYQSNQSFRSNSHSHSQQRTSTPQLPHSYSNPSGNFEVPPRHQKYCGINSSAQHQMLPKKLKNGHEARIIPKQSEISQTGININTIQDEEQNDNKTWKINSNLQNRNTNNSMVHNNNNYRHRMQYDQFYDEEIKNDIDYDESERWEYNDNGADDDRDRENLTSFDKDSTIVCKFYNPYFNSGCRQKQCEYAHLSQKDYQIYCRVMRKQNRMNAFSERKYQDAISYVKSGYLTQALNVFRHLVANYEYNAHFHFWMGRCYALFDNASFEDLESAEFYYQKAIALHPKNASFHSHYAAFMIKLAAKKKKQMECFEHKQAKVHIHKAMELKPSVIEYTLQYAKFLDEVEGEFVEAKKYYKQALEASPFDRRIRLNYARLLHKMGNFRAAKQAFLAIFDISEEGLTSGDPVNNKWIWPHFHYAKLLVDMGYFKLARQEFTICVNIMEQRDYKYFGEIYYEFAKFLYKHLQDYENAYYCISQAKLNAPYKAFYDKLLHSIENAYYLKTETKDYAPSLSTDGDVNNEIINSI